MDEKLTWRRRDVYVTTCGRYMAMKMPREGRMWYGYIREGDTWRIFCGYYGGYATAEMAIKEVRTRHKQGRDDMLMLLRLAAGINTEEVTS